MIEIHPLKFKDESMKVQEMTESIPPDTNSHIDSYIGFLIRVSGKLSNFKGEKGLHSWFLVTSLNNVYHVSLCEQFNKSKHRFPTMFCADGERKHTCLCLFLTLTNILVPSEYRVQHVRPVLRYRYTNMTTQGFSKCTGTSVGLTEVGCI
ncbi:hypothetical protein GQ457_16G029570 [Hibiscus cannabinus]